MLGGCLQGGGCACGIFLQDNVRIGTADAERTDAGPAWERVALCPWTRLRVDVERARRQPDQWIGRAEVELGNQVPVAKHEDGLDRPGPPRRLTQMTQFGFYRADGATSRAV